MKQEIKALALLTGANIRRGRTRLDVSQELLARRIGRSAQYVSLLENGDRCGSLDTYERIAKELNVSLYELFSGKEEDADHLHNERGVLNLFCDCTPFERHVMIAILAAAKEAMRTENHVVK